MKHSMKKIALTSMMSLSLIAGSLTLTPASALAAMNNGGMNAMNGQRGGQLPGMQASAVALADSASDIAAGTTTNSAASLAADTQNAATITVTDADSQVKIEESGTYIITGAASDGSITVKKGTTGVVLILEDLDLTSTTGAAVSVNKESEVQIVVSGHVTLTDAENPDDETSEDAGVADAYDGAAIKVKAGASVYLTGDGTLTVNGNAKNGIKTGEEASLIIDGENLTVDITAANDGINASYDLTIASGSVTVSAADDAIHADRVLTVGSEDKSTSPIVTVSSSTEGLEATVVNIHSGTVSVTSSDDAINAANMDGLYESELAYSINITGGDVTISSRSDGLDSNGNINVTGGSLTIARSASNGGDAGIDYDGSLYISADAAVNNTNGIAGPDQRRGGMMGGQTQGQLRGQMGRNEQQNTAGGQQMEQPDLPQNDQTPADGQPMALPESEQENGFVPQWGQNAAVPEMNGQTENQPLGGQRPGMFNGMQMGGGRQPMTNQPMDRGQGPDGVFPGGRQMPREMGRPGQRTNEMGR